MSRWSAKRWSFAFTATGGLLWIEREGRLGLAWRVYGYTEAQNVEARRLYGMIEAVPLRWMALALFTRWRASPGRALA